jgi:hypothetical protein
MKCGNAAGSYVKFTTIVRAPTATGPYEMPLSQAISGTGNWFCAVSAANQVGESGLSNEVNFEAGAIPVGPTGLVVTGQ